MLFPEIRKALKRFVPDSGEPISLNLKAGAFEASQANWYFNNGFPQIASMLVGGLPAWSGEAVSVETALQHPTVLACMRTISETVGVTPACLKMWTPGGKVDAVNHPMYSAMLNAPNEEMSAQNFTETVTGHCVMQGGGFAKIVRRSGTGTAIGLELLLPEQIQPQREKTGERRLQYVVKEPGRSDKTYTVEPGKPHDIFHLRGLGWDGIRGYSPVYLGRQVIGTAIAAERNLARFWANGGRLPYLLELAQKFKTEDDFKAFRAEWEKVYAEPWRAPITEPGIKHVPIGSTMRDAQGVEQRLQTISIICQVFDVSPPLVHDLSRATFSNIETLFLAFVKLTLSKWISRWEQDFNRCVLTPEERRKGYFLRHNIRELLRGDFKTRMEGYASALQNGHMNVDEVREDNDMDKLPNGIGAHYHIQTNMGTLVKDGQIQAATQPLIRLDQTDQTDEGAA